MTGEAGIFMACAYCWRYHRIDAEGQWVWDSPEEAQEHLAAVKRTKGAT